MMPVRRADGRLRSWENSSSNSLHALPGGRARRPVTGSSNLDLHPYNVMLASRGPMLIDWRNAGDGPGTQASA